MCHEALEIVLNENVNFIVGRNGSGKSAILTALTVGLGAKANVTSRGTSVKGIIEYLIKYFNNTLCIILTILVQIVCCNVSEFIKKGTNAATIEITLSNKGDNAYKPEIYGDIINVVRTIGTTSSYKIKNWRGM